MTDEPVTQREVEILKAHFDEKFAEAKAYTEERFRVHRTQMFLVVGVAVGLLKFQIPDPVTVGAIAALSVKGIYVLLFRH